MAAGQARRFLASDGESAAKFLILEARAAAWRGLTEPVLEALGEGFPAVQDPELRILRLALRGPARTRVNRFDEGKAEVDRAVALCSAALLPACANAFAARGDIAMQQGNHEAAFQFYSRGLAVAQLTHQPFETANAMTSIGYARLMQERYDEAIGWLRDSDRLARGLDAADLLLMDAGNTGWAYYALGDPERALRLYEDAERRAAELGDTDQMILWLMTSGYALQELHDLPAAIDAYRRAHRLAAEIHQPQRVIDALESEAQASLLAARLDEADKEIHQLRTVLGKHSNPLDLLTVKLLQGGLAAGRQQNQQAESLFRQVEQEPGAQVSMRMGAEHQLARLYEHEGRPGEAERMYATALGTFEAARAQLRNEDSKLPFFANATPIYDDSIHLLVSEGKVTEALTEADQSRARTLEQGLGIASGSVDRGSTALRPEVIAARLEATLLFYWLGEKQSYLWAVTSQGTKVFELPEEADIAKLVKRYQEALLGPVDPLEAQDAAGLALYRMLIAPAGGMSSKGGNVVVLCDGVLSRLNFETLLVPGDRPHYWIEDVNVVSAPSLRMLAASGPKYQRQNDRRELLLVGNAVTPGADYPALPNAAKEMREIGKHFAAKDEVVLSGAQATAAAYAASGPERYRYIDFVAHGVASRMDPLDSAIILSRDRTQSLQHRAPGTEPGPLSDQKGNTAEAGDSFKLYAREIIRHPTDARLVTISACYGGGTRSYAGEGLVGLSWAFLRAGAHHVIGALWEVSDESTPRLMDNLYAGIESGQTPSAALRRAKLTMLHSGEGFSRPFYWAPFQIYTGLEESAATGKLIAARNAN